jgi:hypothetical protein
MLAVDAAVRDRMQREKETGQIGQSAEPVRLGGEVVNVLVERADKADRFRAECYAIALARARVADARGFFSAVLADSTGKNYMPGAKFFAAVGLAQLGDAAGYEWLVVNSGDELPTISNARPRGAANLKLNSCCDAALRQLTEKDLSGSDAWQTWWRKANRASLPQARVDIIDL